MSTGEMSSPPRKSQSRQPPAHDQAPAIHTALTASATANPVDALHDETGPLRHVFDAIPDGIVLVDESGRIKLVNRQAEALFGYRSEELANRPVETLMPERFRAVHPSHRDRYHAEPHVRPMGIGLQLFGQRRDGTEFPVEISLSPISVADTALILATIRDVTEQRRLERDAHEELEGRRALLQAVLDELPTGVYLVRGYDARLVLANRRVADLWGAAWRHAQPMAAFLAASGTRVYDPAGRELALEQLATLRALRTGQSVRQMHEVLRRTDGTTVPVQVDAIALDPRIFPYLSEVYTRADEPVPVALVVHQDVSALKETERLKDEFITLAAHELRNPVASLTGYAHLLMRSPRRTTSSQTRRSSRVTRAAEEAAVQEEALTAMVEAASRLTALTDDLLDATRLHANRLTLRPEPCELGALVRRVVRRVQVTVPEQRHPITILAAPLEPVVVVADAQRVEQVLNNLLTNAIKYSPQGGAIEISVSMQAADAAEMQMPPDQDPSQEDAVMPSTPDAQDEGGTATSAATSVVQVTVRDHGMGIPIEQQAHIFGRFARAENARHAAIPGTGLGLYLSRELLERQGGRIWFESAEGAGATFTFELPLLEELPDEGAEDAQDAGGQ